MPFTLDGSWVPSKPAPENQKPVKVRVVKRGKSILTVIFNLNKPTKELLDLASLLKKKLGAGGALKEETIEIQGDKVNEVLKFLKELGIKAS